MFALQASSGAFHERQRPSTKGVSRMAGKTIEKYPRSYERIIPFAVFAAPRLEQGLFPSSISVFQKDKSETFLFAVVHQGEVFPGHPPPPPARAFRCCAIGSQRPTDSNNGAAEKKSSRGCGHCSCPDAA